MQLIGFICFMLAGLSETPPQGEWEMLSGEKVAGRTELLTIDRVEVKTENSTREIHIEDVLRYDRGSDTGDSSMESIPRSLGEARLIDGSVIGFEAVRHVDDGRSLEFEHARLGKFQLPASRISSLRLLKEDRRLTESWKGLLGKVSQNDRLIVKKNESIDFLEGVIGEITDSRISFLLDNEEIPVNRDRVYGVVYPRSPLPRKRGVRVGIGGGEGIVGESVSLEQSEYLVSLGDDIRLKIPAKEVWELDYSLGKVLYLSDLEPLSVDYVPMFNVIWKYRRDKSLDGNPIRINGKSYSRGLSIHSKTTLTYQVPDGYSRLRGMMGIDDEISRVSGNVDVVISSVSRDRDVRELLRKSVRSSESSVPIDLAIPAGEGLRITVDFGEGLDIGDHLDLAEARIVR